MKIAAVSTPLSFGKEAGNPKPHLGIVVNATGPATPNQVTAKVRALGFQTCQVHVGMATSGLAGLLKEAEYV